MLASSAPASQPAADTAEIIPSISFEALLARRDAAVAQLNAIAVAAQAYLDIGVTIRLTPSSPHESLPYRYGRALDGRHGPHIGSAEWLKTAAATLDAILWDHLLSCSGLRTFMDAKARKEWDDQIEKLKTPPLTPENVQATFRHLHAQRGELFERGVLSVFRSLSWDYKTNRPCRFGHRIIVRYLVDAWGHPREHACDGLEDLERAFHVLDNKPEPDHRAGIRSRIWQRKREERSEDVVDDYLRIRTFKNGNGHVTFLRPDLVDELNRIVARHHPDALPPSCN